MNCGCGDLYEEVAPVFGGEDATFVFVGPAPPNSVDVDGRSYAFTVSLTKGGTTLVQLTGTISGDSQPVAGQITSPATTTGEIDATLTEVQTAAMLAAVGQNPVVYADLWRTDTGAKQRISGVQFSVLQGEYQG